MKELLDAGFTISIQTERIAPHLGRYIVSFWKDLVRPKSETKRRKWQSVHINEVSDAAIEAAIAPYKQHLLSKTAEDYSQIEWESICRQGM